MSAVMKDRYGRKIDYLRISVTDRCNLRCRYCMPQEGVSAWKPGQILSFEEIEEIVRAAAELGSTAANAWEVADRLRWPGDAAYPENADGQTSRG